MEYVRDFFRTAQSEHMCAYQLLLQQAVVRELSSPEAAPSAPTTPMILDDL